MRHPNFTATALQAFAPFASMPALAPAPDSGNVVLLIPVLIKNEGCYRDVNFRFLLKQYSKAGVPFVIAQQLIKGSENFLGKVIKELAPSAIHHVLETDSELVHKSQLVNEGCKIAFEELDARYVWQVDADIFVHAETVITQLGILNSVTVPVIKPLLYFSRLDAAATEDLLNLSELDLAEYDPPGSERTLYRVESLFGPGTIIFSKAAFLDVGGMDDSYTGWGWEDMDFSERLTEKFPVHTLPFRGVHLHHEEDRVPNPENVNRFFAVHRESTSTFQKESILAHTHFDNILHKHCIISSGSSPIATMLAGALDQHPQISFADEIFSPDALESEYPIEDIKPNAYHQYIALSLGRKTTTHSGFIYVPRMLVHSPFFEPDTVSPDHILEFLVVNDFKFILLRHHCHIGCVAREVGHLFQHRCEPEKSREIVAQQIHMLQTRHRGTLKTISRMLKRHGSILQKSALEVSDTELDESWESTVQRILGFLGAEKQELLSKVDALSTSKKMDPVENYLRTLG